MTTLPIHPDDLLFFHEVVRVMRRVASDYDLPLRNVAHDGMPATGMADRMGACNASGDIFLVLRCTIDGVWCDAPLSPEEVWRTAAHELAHLKHFNHGPSFLVFEQEMMRAVENVHASKEDHRDKILRKILLMKQQAEGEAALGNSEAAEAFASAVNRMMLKNELSASDVEYAKAKENDPIIEVRSDLSQHHVEKVNRRVAWQESLARIVARGHLCSFLIVRGSNQIIFVGTKAHATVAEYTFGVLVSAADRMSLKARHDFREGLRKELGIPSGKSLRGVGGAFGFRESWLAAFVQRIGERLEEARIEAIRENAVETGTQSTAMIRLDGALAKVQGYINDKFAGRRVKNASSLRLLERNNAAGAEAGRTAANRMAIGRKAVTEGTVAARRRMLR